MKRTDILIFLIVMLTVALVLSCYRHSQQYEKEQPKQEINHNNYGERN
jgi:flagellar basal body-associated protein FliL